MPLPKIGIRAQISLVIPGIVEVGFEPFSVVWCSEICKKDVMNWVRHVMPEFGEIFALQDSQRDGILRNSIIS